MIDQLINQENKMTTAWYGDPQLKACVMDRLREDRRLDRIAQGFYWEEGRGCHLGCLTRANNETHKAAARMFGLPIKVAYLLEAIFEGLPKEECEWWVIAGTEAIPVGADLSRVHHELACWLLGPESPSAQGNADPLVADAVLQVRELHRRAAAGESVAGEEWSAAKSAVRSASSAAWSAARSAAWSAEWSAAWSAESAAWSAEWAAEWSAVAVAVARSAESAASLAAWRLVAEKTIEIFQAAPLVGCNQCAETAEAVLAELNKRPAAQVPVKL